MKQFNRIDRKITQRDFFAMSSMRSLWLDGSCPRFPTVWRHLSFAFIATGWKQVVYMDNGQKAPDCETRSVKAGQGDIFGRMNTTFYD